MQYCQAGSEARPLRVACRLPITPLVAVVVLYLAPVENLPGQPLDRLSILAPAPAGGGFDQTARAVRESLLAAGLAREVSIENSPGAGGVVGLAQFVNGQRGDERAFLIGGRVMLSAIRASRATVSLAQSTPLARLSGEYEVVVVPPGSKIRDLSDLVRALRTSPDEYAWGGGSLGGADQLFLAELASALGLDASSLPYVPLSGAAEVASALHGGRIALGISGWGGLAAEVEAGRLRALAVSSESRLPGSAVPTLREQGVGLGFVNWRGLFAPPGLDDEQRERLRILVEKMVRSDEWRRALERHRWADLYLAGDGFIRFLLAEEERVARAPLPDLAGAARTRGRPASSLSRWSIALLVLAGLALLGGQRLAALRREQELFRRLEEAEEKYRQRSAETQELLRGLGDHIDRQFRAWGLSAAESEIAWLMLKGLRHKEIASMRGTSYGTVRQQALTVYKKAKLDGRTDLAAFFLEDLLQPPQPVTRASA